MKLRTFILTALVVPFMTVKVAFVYVDTQKRDFQRFVKPSVHPTLRISTEVYPTMFRHTNASMALSDVSKVGNIKPLAIGKLKLGGY